MGLVMIWSEVIKLELGLSRLAPILPEIKRLPDLIIEDVIRIQKKKSAKVKPVLWVCSGIQEFLKR